MPMQAGSLRHWLMVEKPSTTRDDAGQVKDNWFALPGLYAGIAPLTGAEAIESGRQVNEVSHMIKCRYRVDLAPEMRLVTASGRKFYILKILNVGERNRELNMECLERV